MAAVPTLRFPEFEGDWRSSQISDEAKVTSGGTPSRTNPLYWNGDIPWITTSEVKNEIITSGKQFITQKALENSSAKLFPKETVLVAMYGQGLTRGRTAILGVEAATNQACAAIISKDNLVFAFLFHNLEKRYWELREIANDGGQKNLSGGLIKNLKIVLPDVAEQTKIAEFLGTVDEKIRLLEARHEQLTLYKKAMMQKIFSQTLLFKRDDGGEFPDWEEKQIGIVYDWVRTNSLSRANLNYKKGELQNIHYGDIHTKFSTLFRQSDEHVPFVTGSNISDFSPVEICRVGDVVIADASEDYNDIGKAIEIVSLAETPLVAGLHTYIARPKAGTVAIGFSAYLFQSRRLRLELMRIAQGISVLGISKSNIEKITVKLPMREEQQKIADFLSAIDDKIDAVSAQITQMQSFKKGLLQQMFV